jgi:hypothetical protein
MEVLKNKLQVEVGVDGMKRLELQCNLPELYSS